jgi:hypothetical protein
MQTTHEITGSPRGEADALRATALDGHMMKCMADAVGK